MMNILNDEIKNDDDYKCIYTKNKLCYSFICSFDPQTGGKPKITNKYYVLHSTSYENLLGILNSKMLFANEYTNITRLSGVNPSEYVFCNLIKNGDNIDNFGFGLIFSE